MALTKPVALTLATAVSLDTHVSDLSEAFAGKTVAFIWRVVPVSNVALSASRLTEATLNVMHRSSRKKYPGPAFAAHIDTLAVPAGAMYSWH